MLFCLGEPLVRLLCCCCSFLMCILICQYSSFCSCSSSFISRLLYHVTGTTPWLLRPAKASTSSELYPNYFWLRFLFHLPRALLFWVGILYLQAFFTLCSFPKFLAHPAFIKASLGGEPAVFPWNLWGLILILEAQTRRICLFGSQ